MTAPTAATARAENAPSDIELNEKQYAFVYDDEHKFVAYLGGIGAGKSYSGAVKALRHAVEQPGSLGLIGAPTYPMLRDATMRSVWQVFPEALIANYNKTDGVLSLINGSEILFRSTDDPDRLRGPNLAWYWLDEGPLCGYYAWNVLKGRLRQSGYDVQGWITGTPHGEDRFYEAFENWENTGAALDGHALYRASTRENLHNLPPTFIEDLGYTGNFALQEIEGLFVAFEGLVYEYRPEWHNGEWVKLADDGNLRHAALRLGGVDWGYSNPAVALPMYVDGEDRVYVLDEYYTRNVGLTGASQTVGEGGQSAAILDFTRRYGIEVWYCGPDEPEHITALNAMFGRHNLKARAVAAEDEIVPGIETVRRQMALRPDNRSTGFYLSARCVNTKMELRTYRYPSASNRVGARDPQDKPIKAMDHALDAARYAIHTALGNRALRGASSLSAEQLVRKTSISEIGGLRIMKRTF